MKPEPTRVVYGRTLVELGEHDPRVVVLEADIAKSTNTFQFKERFPERFFQAGVAELNMVCMAAGMSATGLRPFCSTFAVFASMRACEGIRTSICYPRLNVKIVATNGGVEICGDGVTHQGVEDISIMRSMANLTVLAPSDPVTTRKATLAIAAYDGPVYMRLGRQTAAVLHRDDEAFELGRMIPLRGGDDVAIVAFGNMVEQALIAAAELDKEGIQARVLDCHTIKPIDMEALRAAALETRGIVTAEDHNVVGGLGGAVAEAVSAECPTIVRRVGLRDRFASSGRDYRKLLHHYQIDAAAIVSAARGVMEASRSREAVLLGSMAVNERE
ncbi:MAG TPA: transketolase C-terminal domain-containing protein [Bryobacteraceae bacterium]|nr:transketolase C-terminal domain-containing protein [Bryobacteraceae bacterium]